MENSTQNQQIHLISRPQGLPTTQNFKLSEGLIPAPGNEEVLVKVLYLSVDPYMRGRIGGRPSSHPPFPLNKPANGDGVGKVIRSNHPDFRPGDYVCGYLDWAEYSIAPGNKIWKFHPEEISPSAALSVLGMPAMTAYFGLLDIGKPEKGETVVITAAAGAVGTIVGQIAKLKGCRVIGIAGSDAKTHFLKEELRFDAAVNYKNPDWVQHLKEACEGVDIYFDNVGGEVTDEVMKHLNRKARIVLCGQISSYNLEQPDIGPRNFRHLIVKSATAKGIFVMLDYQHRFPEGREQLLKWFKEGKIKPCESIVQGLENTPKALLDLFSGQNLGKQLIQLT